MGKHFDRAEVLFNQGRHALAEKELRSEIAQNPQSADVHALLAVCLINQKKQQQNLINSIQHLAQQAKLPKEEFELIQYALSVDANNAWYHYILAMCWYRHGNLNRAKNQIEVSISLDPTSPHYLYMSACILFDIGNFQYNVMSAATRGFAEFSRTYLIRPYLKPVFEPLKKSLALNPNSLTSLNLLTNLYVTTGRYRQALESSETALSRDPNNAKAQDLHGQILNNCGKYVDAIEYFQAALRIDPNYTQAKNNLLEATRSKYYWIYPWISLNHAKGKIVFVSLIPGLIPLLLLIRYIVTGSVNIQTPWENLGFAPAFFFLVVGFPAQWIVNYFLIKSGKAQFLLTERDAVVANFALSLSITVLLWMYTCLLPLDSPFRSLAMNLVGITAGISVPPFTFSAVKQVRFPILPIVYSAMVGLFGVINLVLYFQNREMILLMELFMVLVIGTPVAAVYNCQKSH